MSTNPYQPPQAEVVDFADTTVPRPRSVHLACQLLLASFALGMVTLLPGIQPVRPGDPPVPWIVTLIVVAILAAITLGLVYAVHTRRNWARWATLAFLALGWWLTFEELSVDFQLSPLAGLISLVCIALELVVAWLLFTGNGARWFKR